MLDEPVWAALLVGLLGLALELAGAVIKSPLNRRLFYLTSLIASSFACAVAVVQAPDIMAVPAVAVLFYRCVNAMRVIYNRIQAARLYQSSRRSSFMLCVFQLITLGLWYLSVRQNVNTGYWLGFLMALSAVGAGVMVLSLRYNLRKTLLRPGDKIPAGSDLPSVSVCMPARNETADLPACMESVLASDYPKLEILVLDDCSHDQTSEIIKSFAQKGVRFIRGEKPHKSWLAKNQAYNQLAEAASGDVLLFCGVDARLEPQTIRTLVGLMLSRKKLMLSVLPKGLQVLGHAGLVQPMRYWWELALPRRLVNRPPVLSTVWLIEKASLRRLGGFAAVSNKIIPEAYFAHELAKEDAYSFLRVGGKLSLATTKQFDEQWQTAVRTHYPQLRKRPENVCLLTLAEALVLGLPLSLFITGFIVPLGWLWVAAGLISVMLGYAHYLVIRAWSLTGHSLPLALFPVAVGLDIFLLNLSMWRYEFGEVRWKDRNVCIPVMRVERHLPPA